MPFKKEFILSVLMPYVRTVFPSSVVMAISFIIARSISTLSRLLATWSRASSRGISCFIFIPIMSI